MLVKTTRSTHPDIVKDDENSLIGKRADKYILGWLFLLLRAPEPIVNLRRCHITLRRYVIGPSLLS